MRTRYCVCTGTIVDPGKGSCDGCAQAKTILIGCGQGLRPCGDTTTIDLKTFNSNSAAAVYSLRSKDNLAFAAVTISAAGIVNLTTGLYYIAGGTYEIQYQVIDGENGNWGTIRVCFDNVCLTGCLDCNYCSGACYTKVDRDIATSCGAIGTIDLNTVVVTTPCDGVNTYIISTEDSSIGTLTVNASGIISYGMATPAPTGKHVIDYEVRCSKYGMYIKGIITLTVVDQCVGVVLADNEMCDPCTGLVVIKESDLSGSISGSGASAGNSISSTFI